MQIRERLIRLPFYDEYLRLLSEKEDAARELQALEDPEKELARIRKFYENIGADYTRNSWIATHEKNRAETEESTRARMAALRDVIRAADAFEAVVTKQDDESYRAVLPYQNDPEYAGLFARVRFFVGVSRSKTEPEMIERAGMAIESAYPAARVSLFLDEGLYYYLYYLECLQICVRRFRGTARFQEVREAVKGRVMNLRLMIAVSGNEYLSEAMESLENEVNALDRVLNEIQETGAG